MVLAVAEDGLLGAGARHAPLLGATAAVRAVREAGVVEPLGHP